MGLVDNICKSVSTLESLFSELMDVSRIDAGAVDVRPQPLRMEELFAHLRFQFDPLAFEKGLALSFRGGQHLAYVDPILLERVLRNLLSNAIRYTEDGGVLLSCRVRGGNLLVQVWDSGIGIDAEFVPRVYDEFFQVKRPARDPAVAGYEQKGMGLGLAIVKRLADLMQVPLSLHSRLGRGSTFSILLPVLPHAARVGHTTGLLEPERMQGLTLKGMSLLVVEDDAAARDALVLLLESWDASVLAVSDLAGVQTWARQQTGPNGPCPDLLLVDYELPLGHNGIEAMQCVRETVGFPVPAIMITGTDLREREADALAYEFHLLSKPVSPNKLRAMIAFKLGKH